MELATPALRFAFLEDDAATKANQQFAALTTDNLAREEIDAAKADVMNLRDALYRGGVKEDAPQWDEVRRLQERFERKKAARSTGTALARATDLSSAAKDRLLDSRRTVGGRKIEDLEPVAVEVEIPAGATVMDALAVKISELVKKEHRREAVKASRLPPEMVERALIRDVDTLAAQGEIQISGLHGEAKRARLAWPTRAINAEPNRFGGNGDQPRVVDMEALACRFWRKEIVADIKAAVKAAYEGPEGDEVFDPHERQKVLRALDADIELLQRQVAELTWAAIETGHDVDFPSGLPAKAILGIA